MTKQEVLIRLGLLDAFAGFVPDPSAELWGWNGEEPVFEELIGARRPKLVFEVGAWLGQSTVTMAKALKHYCPESALITVDTWLGSQEHWLEPDLRPHLQLRHGRPTLYERFLSNVAAADCADVVVPLPNTSTTAALILAAHSLRADLIYIDGSHEASDVYADISAYWQLLAEGGVMFGDDWDLLRPQVMQAVEHWCAEHHVPYRIDGINWILEKPRN